MFNTLLINGDVRDSALSSKSIYVKRPNYVKGVNSNLFNILCVEFNSYVWIGICEMLEVKKISSKLK